MHQLLDTPIAQHHLHESGLGFTVLGVDERELNGVKPQSVVTRLGRMAFTPSVPTGRLACPRENLCFSAPSQGELWDEISNAD